jgi:hypothetical protein
MQAGKKASGSAEGCREMLMEEGGSGGRNGHSLLGSTKEESQDRVREAGQGGGMELAVHGGERELWEEERGGEGEGKKGVGGLEKSRAGV